MRGRLSQYGWLPRRLSEVDPVHEDTTVDGGASVEGGGMTRGFFVTNLPSWSFVLRIDTRILGAGGTARVDSGAVGLFFVGFRLAMTLCLRAWIRSEASLLQVAATQGRDEAGLGALDGAMA